MGLEVGICRRVWLGGNMVKGHLLGLVSRQVYYVVRVRDELE